MHQPQINFFFALPPCRTHYTPITISPRKDSTTEPMQNTQSFPLAATNAIIMRAVINIMTAQKPSQQQYYQRAAKTTTAEQNPTCLLGTPNTSHGKH